MSADLPPIGSSYETAYFCGLCEQDPKKRIVALYDDSREGSLTYSEAKRDSMLSGIGESQWPYVNLLAIGYVKKWGNIYHTSEELIAAVEKEYKIGNDNIVCGIYKITNLKTGMIYIGQSIDIYKRWREHTTNSNSALSQDIKLLGKNYFKFEIIEKCSQEQLYEREQYWINYYESDLLGYNIQSSSTNTINNPSWHATPIYAYDLSGKYLQSFDSIAEAARSIQRSTAGIQKCLKYNDNRHSSGGYMWSLNKVDQITPYEELPHGANKKIHQYDKDTRLWLGAYDSYKDAAHACGYNTNKTHIAEVIKGTRPTCFGYIWATEYFDRLPKDYYQKQEVEIIG